MNSNHFRIGNNLYGVSDRVETISSIFGDNTICSYPGLLKEAVHYAELKDCTPIPLTDEILLKCGFELKNQWFDYELDNMRIGYITNDEFFQFEGAGIIDIKHLHQLQNLYFALTSKELVYTP